ncbi:MAG TPA: putative metal-dependent hydrolase [Candidatus Acidoferrum sp.]|jgi:hypothetical protein|nr:putative metal-dependent hydrolase [Candidatus Acidoferrum sp.]
MSDDLRFPIGQPDRHMHLTAEQRVPLIENMAQFPARLGAAVAGLSGAQLDTPYRPSGWTVRQLTHHLADSHMNAFVRFKLALTEDKPTIKTYEESLWAETPEAKTPAVETSLGLMENLHKRWVILLRAMTDEQWARQLTHPERGLVTLDENLCLYSWHCLHHVAHITGLRKREGWNSSGFPLPC